MENLLKVKEFWICDRKQLLQENVRQRKKLRIRRR